MLLNKAILIVKFLVMEFNIFQNKYSVGFPKKIEGFDCCRMQENSKFRIQVTGLILAKCYSCLKVLVETKDKM